MNGIVRDSEGMNDLWIMLMMMQRLKRESNVWYEIC